MTDLRDAAPAQPVQWDGLVRLTHWAIAALVLANLFVTEGGKAVHVWLGYGLLALLVLRLIWGFLGPRPARFAAFPPRPFAALAHLRDLARGRRPAEYGTHNPAGALMAYAIWAMLAVMIGTGLTMQTISPFKIAERETMIATGDWSHMAQSGLLGAGAMDKDEPGEDAGYGAQHEGEDDEGEDEESMIGEFHEAASTLLIALIVLHLLGVALESRAMGRNLVAPMIRRGRP